jgi:MFS family permease
VLLAALAAFMTALDTLVVTTTLPVLWVQLHAGLSGLEWTVNPYNLAFACCLLTGAALGDRFGRRRTLGTGLALSTAASAACALSSGVETSETGVLAGDANGPTEREDSARACARLVAGLITSAASKQDRRRGLGASADNAHERAADLLSPAPRYFASPGPKSRVARIRGRSHSASRPNASTRFELATSREVAVPDVSPA